MHHFHQARRELRQLKEEARSKHAVSVIWAGWQGTKVFRKTWPAASVEPLQTLKSLNLSSRSLCNRIKRRGSQKVLGRMTVTSYIITVSEQRLTSVTFHLVRVFSDQRKCHSCSDSLFFCPKIEGTFELVLLHKILQKFIHKKPKFKWRIYGEIDLLYLR